MHMCRADCAKVLLMSGDSSSQRLSRLPEPTRVPAIVMDGPAQAE